MAIDPSLLDQLRERASLLALAQAATSLRRQGPRYLGRCPFHQERSASFTVDPQKNLFHCFGCQAGGDVFAFYMQLHAVGFLQAVRELAASHGLQSDESPHEREQQQAARAQQATLTGLQEIFRRQLGQPEAKAARALLRARGVTPATARVYGIGYGGTPEKFAERAQRADLTPQLLEQAGVRVESGGACLFIERLTFPIAGITGELHGFGGRALDDGERIAKYVNSRDCARFHKHEELFGLAQAAPAMRRHKTAVLCEGYFDVVAMAQAGIAHGVAALGTQFTVAHADKLSRLVEHVVLAFDGDAAGAHAARRAHEVLRAHSLKVSVAALPSGEDPASLLVARGSEFLRQRIEHPTSAVEHFIEKAFRGAGDSVEARVAAAQDVAAIVLGLPSRLERELYTARVAVRVGVSPEMLGSEWSERARRERRSGSKRQPERNREEAQSADAAAGHAQANAGAEGRRRIDATIFPRSPPAGTAPGAADASAAAGDGGLPNAGAPGSAADVAAEAGPPDYPGRWDAAAVRAVAEQELGLVRELLLHPSAWAQAEPLCEYLVNPGLRQLVQRLSALPKDLLQADGSQQFDVALTQCVRDLRAQHLLRAAVPAFTVALDEHDVRANRTKDDILRRLKRRQVDWALTRVLAELADLERRGEATDGLVRRKQLLAATKRALGRAPR